MNILLLCNAGMSTGIMQMKLEEEAVSRGLEASVKAVPMVELEEYKNDADVVLLGPQIRFAEDEIKEAVKENTLVMVIDSQDFGMMNAKKVIDDLLSKLKE